MQRSLILLKPDCIQKAIIGQVISRFEGAGYTIIASKIVQLDEQNLIINIEKNTKIKLKNIDIQISYLKQ